jgi:autophagy-related protein 2
LCEDQGWGIEVTNGRIGSVSVNIPWNALMTADSFIEVTGLHISFRPKARQTDGTSMLESMWSSMSSSMQLAQECLEKEGDLPALLQTQLNPMEGLERFAHTIENGRLSD